MEPWPSSWINDSLCYWSFQPNTKHTHKITKFTFKHKKFVLCMEFYVAGQSGYLHSIESAKALKEWQRDNDSKCRRIREIAHVQSVTTEMFDQKLWTEFNFVFFRRCSFFKQKKGGKKVDVVSMFVDKMQWPLNIWGDDGFGTRAHLTRFEYVNLFVRWWSFCSNHFEWMNDSCTIFMLNSNHISDGHIDGHKCSIELQERKKAPAPNNWQQFKWDWDNRSWWKCSNLLQLAQNCFGKSIVMLQPVMWSRSLNEHTWENNEWKTIRNSQCLKNEQQKKKNGFVPIHQSVPWHYFFLLLFVAVANFLAQGLYIV